MKFNITGFQESEIFIGHHFGNQKFLVDSVSVDNGKFIFSIKDPKQGIYFLYTPNYYLEFILDGNSFSFETSVIGGYKELQVKGSIENNLFKKFQVELGSLQNEQRSLIAKLNTANTQDSLLIYEQLDQMNGEMKIMRGKLINENENTFFAQFLKLLDQEEVPAMFSVADVQQRNLLRYLYAKNHYFPDELLADPRMLRTPVLHEKAINYFENVIIQQPDSINQALDWFFGQLKRDQELERYWLVTLFKLYADNKTMGMDAVTIHLIENYYLKGRAPWISEEYRKQLKDEVAFTKPNLLGKIAPPIDAVDSLMQPFYLDRISSPYTLLFIYDPDCGHCKKTIALLEKQDEKVNELGITIVALCTTTDIKRWKEFVRQANPNWIHLIDPTGKSYFRVQYDVRSTPKIYLLDGDKKILAKKLETDQFLDFTEWHSANARQ
ncbi:MAG: arsenate reductase-like glutaredoxin family protein [Marinoscillum sp.]|jgi:arsenate reductase-like glutaredoxin family protein